MNLEIESSEITRFDTFDRGDGKRYELPIVSKRNIKSVVIVPSAQQLYIGGLYTNNTGDLVRKVPILGDVPGLGILLRGFNKKKRQSETVFQITPTIMRPGQGISTEDNIFRNLLRGDDDQVRILDEQRYLDEASQTSPFDRVIPDPVRTRRFPKRNPKGISPLPIMNYQNRTLTPGYSPKTAVQPPPQSREPARIFNRPERYRR